MKVKPMGGWIYMILGAFLNGGASIFLKHAALRNGIESAFKDKVAFLFVALALLCYVGAFGMYYLALKHIEVGTAYLVMTAIAALLISMYGFFIFGNALSISNALGGVLVLIGIVLLYK